MRGSVRIASLTLATIGLFAVESMAQAKGSTGGRSPNVAPSSTRTSTTPNTVPQTVFYAGKVVLDNGVPPATPVAVIRSCSGVSHRETYTTGDGSFSFIVGDRYREVTPDASEDPHNFTADTQLTRNQIVAAGQNNPQSFVSDCEIRAELQGYSSTAIRLDPSMNNSTVGIIMLHSRTKKAEGMVTVASLAVPAKARREYEKGSEQLEKGNLADAEKSLRKAIDEYPKFAEAWTRLGDLEQRRKNTEAATKDYQEAINSDPNLPPPYQRMTLIEAQAGHWEDARRLSEKVIALDVVDFPLAYYYNAVAEFNLKHIDKAESMALRAESADKQHVEPRVELLLASIYVTKDSYATAADHYRAYLKLVPNGPLTERVKTDLARIEQLAKSQAPQTPANP